MKIENIITGDAERLLIVDRECCLVYTGDSPGERRPFIRMGTWKDMPRVLTEMIETVILPESVEGNPAHERFNMDMAAPGNNHYIGLSHTIGPFLEYQRSAGIDPADISVTVVEKDLPSVPSEPADIPRGDYIGIFSRDGNVALAREGKTIFDLSVLRDNPFSTYRMMAAMSGRYRESRRYAGTGLVVAGGAPFFYSAGAFTALSPPAACLEDLAGLGVDPAAIATIIDPGGDADGTVQFMRWKHIEGGGLRIFSDSRYVSSLGALFPACGLEARAYTGLSLGEGGLEFRQVRPASGLKVAFDMPRGPVQALFVGDGAQADEITRKNHDLLVLGASLYEHLALLLKGTDRPVAVIDDGSPLASRIYARNVILLLKGVQYEIVRPESRAALEELCGVPADVTARLRRGEIVPDEEMRSSAPGGRNGTLMNMAALLRSAVDTVTDRTESARLTALLDILNAKFNRAAFRAGRHSVKVLLCLIDGSLYQVAVPVDSPGAVRVFDTVRALSASETEKLPPETVRRHERILADRERLAALITIHAPAVREKALPAEDGPPQKGEEMRAAAETNDEPGGAPKGFPIKKTALALLSAALLAGMTAAVLLLTEKGPFRRPGSAPADGVVESSALDRQWGLRSDEHGVSVDDNDIHIYANDVAVRNGYLKIAPYRFKEKNPSWIYPDTVFVLPDGQKVRISRGDTLWNLSRNKLIEAGVLFERKLGAARAARTTERPAILDEAEKYAITPGLKARLEKARSAGGRAR